MDKDFYIENKILKKYKGKEKEAVIPEGVISIGDWAFYDCKSLTSVIIPEGVRHIGYRAFYNCSNIASITIPRGVKSIYNEAFKGCKKMTKADLPEGLKDIGSRLFSGCTLLTSMTIPKGVTAIGANTFEGCTSLKTVSIPESVTYIGDSAFRGCSTLSKVTIPENVMYIGDKLFDGCESLSAIVLPQNGDVDWLVHLKPNGLLGDGFSSYMNELCRSENENGMTFLIAKTNKWPTKWKKLFFASYIYSDTRAAMLLADKRGELSRYASMRNVDEDELRDRMLSDLGLDEHRCKYYDLGNTTIIVRLLPDFRFSLEMPNGTAVKSLPKKGADQEKYTAAKTDFAQIKKDVVKIWKNRVDKLLRDFLSGRECTAEYWKRIYGGNPILHGVACLLVWEQGGEYFIRIDGGTVHYNGTPYELTDKPIRLAHPMEMAGAEVNGWQKYFTSHGLKQPFEQIWEPVEAMEMVKPGRYDGCTVPLYALMNKEKHGIIMEGQKKLVLQDCAADLVFIKGHHDWVNNEFEVRNFRFDQYTRQVNHIVTHLDKVTVAGRIKKDDVTVARWFDRFTLAQIAEFIKLAQEANAVNVLAQLLEYRNTHFAYFDPMDEFTLE